VTAAVVATPVAPLAGVICGAALAASARTCARRAAGDGPPEHAASSRHAATMLAAAQARRQDFPIPRTMSLASVVAAAPVTGAPAPRCRCHE